MKLKIHVNSYTFTRLPEIIKKGDWVDLCTNKDIILEGPKSYKGKVTFSSTLIPLGVAMRLPKGCEAIVAPRSSTFNKYGIIQSNSIGVIDWSYNGDSDEWKMPVIAFRDTEIIEGFRACQFRIQLSQKATFWQKIKWLLSSGIKIVAVDELGSINRGGFGSTDK